MSNATQSGSTALPTPVHEHLIKAHSSLDDTATALSAARLELHKLRERAQILVLTADELAEMLVEWATVADEMRAHTRVHTPFDVTETAKAEWSALCQRNYRVEERLKQLGRELRVEREATSEAAQ